MGYIRYTVRSLIRSPAYALLSIVVMALGVGLTLELYAVGRAMAFTPMTVPNNDNLVFIARTQGDVEFSFDSIDPFSLERLREQQQSFSEMGAFRSTRKAISNGTRVERFSTALIEPQLFDMAGTKALLGRYLQADDLAQGAPPVAVISHHLWSHFFGERDVVGHTYLIDGAATTIVGVMPKGYGYPVSYNLWQPLDVPQLQQPRLKQWFNILARLKADVSVSEASADMVRIYESLAAEYPDPYVNIRAKVWPTGQYGLGGNMIVIYMQIVAGIVVLLLAIFNISSLLLSRASDRHKDIAIRSAMGSPRSALLKTTLTESLLVCVCGGVLGFLMAGWNIECNAELVNLSRFTPFWFDLSVDTHIAYMGLGLVVSVWLLTGLYPSLKVMSINILDTLKGYARGNVSRDDLRFTAILLNLQVMMSCFLLIVGITFIYSSYRIINTDYGINPDNLVIADTFLPDTRYSSHQQIVDYVTQVQSTLQQHPKVADVALSTNMPTTLPIEWIDYRVEGQSVPESRRLPHQMSVSVTDNYFDVTQAQLLAGRAFTPSDTADSKPVIVVEHLFAQKQWPNESAIGKRIQLSPKEDGRWYTVVGVVKHIQAFPWGHGYRLTTLYRSYRQAPSHKYVVALKTELPVPQLAETVEAAAKLVDPLLPLTDVRTLNDNINQATVGGHLLADIFIRVALVLLLLASCGIYGLVVRSVKQRRHEFSVKRALGATETAIICSFLWRLGRQLSVGMIVGVLLAVAVLINSDAALPNLHAYFYYVIAWIVVVLTGVIAIASYLPVRKALQQEPLRTLNYDA